MRKSVKMIVVEMRAELDLEDPNWNEIATMAHEAHFLEDCQDYGYSRPQPTIDDLAENDIEMAGNGFKFAPGELEWYLKQSELSETLARLIRKAINEKNQTWR